MIKSKFRLFNSFEEFFDFFKVSQRCSIRLTSEEIAYFEVRPYSKDNVIIRGWIREFNHEEVRVSFKYKEFSLGETLWSFEEAKRYIHEIHYYYNEEEQS